MILAILLALHLTAFEQIVYRLAGCDLLTYPVSPDVVAVKWVCK